MPRPMTLATLALAVLFPACNEAALGPLPAGGHHVLFIGNSLTYVNNLPGTLSDLATSVGDTIRVASVAKPDYALIDHANESDARNAIAADKWELVILQQGPTSQSGVFRDTLILGVQRLDERVRAAGGRTAMYEVWPSKDRLQFFDEVLTSYRQAAQAVNGMLMPVGETWRAIWSQSPDAALYGPDNFHPSPLGTYVAAVVMYEKITGHDARALPDVAIVNGTTLSAPVATVQLIQQAAHETIARYP